MYVHVTTCTGGAIIFSYHLFYPFMITGATALFGVQRLDFGPSLLGSELLHTRTSELEHPPAHREGKIFKSALSLVGVNHHPAF
jgi:hypothetical protein